MHNDRAVLSQRAFGTGDHVALTTGAFRIHARFENTLADDETTFELYDVSHDPWEHENVSAVHPARFNTMKSTLEDIWNRSLRIHEHYHSKAAAPQAVFTDEQRRRIESLGDFHSPQ